MPPAPWNVERGQDEAAPGATQAYSAGSPERTQGLLVTDVTNPGTPVIIHASPGFEKLTGYSQAEVLGQGCEFLRGPGTDPDFHSQVRQAMKTGSELVTEVLTYRKDGTSFWNEISLFPLHDSSGELTQVVGVHTDVSQRRRIEEQFLQSQKLEALGHLAGGVAHDFNSLLTVINGYSDMIKEGLASDSPLIPMLEEIRRAGQRSAELTQQLLASSRRQVLTPRKLDLNSVVRKAAALLRRLLAQDIMLESELSEGLWPVMADPAQLEQVLMNLAVNARDAMPRGGTLRLQTTNHQGDNGRQVLLTITDSGCGIRDEHRDRLFEPFFTTKRQGHGTGLGLSTVHGIISQSGGQITVESELEVGTTFHITLPALEPELALEPQPANEPANSGKRTVLVVEDENGLRSLVLRVLHRAGYAVHQAADGGEGLAFLDGFKGRIDLLLTDVVMPGANGPQVAEAALQRDPSTRVLYMSGYTDDDVIRRGVLRDEVPFLPKPFTPSDLARKVSEVLEG